MIIGSLLGDACLECRSIGVRTPITARFRVHHGLKQKEYVLWKYNVLREFVNKEPSKISWSNPKRNLHETSYYFHTKSMRELGYLYHYFYKNGQKVLPQDIFTVLNPRMIAVWFMDDGSNTKESFTLNTHNFPQEEQMRIVKFFRDSYRINATIVKDRTKLKISIGKYSFQDFTAIVLPYIIPSMVYKIANPRNDLSRHGGAERSALVGGLLTRQS